mgnify:CR=1 FL=1
MKIVLCDSTTINSYGFRTDVEGIDLTRFNKNPVMLYNHNPEQVIGKWENIEIDNTKLIAEPVFDLDDPFAAEIARKIEQGFIKGCSMGIVIKNLTISKNIDTATESVLIEASIVSIPADENALVVYDNEETKQKLSINEFNKLFYTMETGNKTQSTQSTPPDTEVVNLRAELSAKDDIIADLSTQIDELKNELAHIAYLEAESFANEMVNKGKIKAEFESDLKAMYLENKERTLKLIDSIIVPKVESEVRPTDLLTANAPSSNDSWDKADKENRLAFLKDSNFEEFERLYKEKFGVDYNN